MPLPLAIRGHTLTWGARTYVMGILNITPDSFSGDGLLSSSPSSSTIPEGNGGGQGGGALDQALAFLAAGGDILDVGGESTRPGAQPVGADEEMAGGAVIAAIAATPIPIPWIPTKPASPRPP
jgi:dihydropteroate synthase